MAYKITYGPAGPASLLKKQVIRKLLIKLVAAALILAFRFSGIGDRITAWLIPGDAAVTTAAWNGFTEDIAEGEQLSDALDAFCRHIIENAKLP